MSGRAPAQVNLARARMGGEGASNFFDLLCDGGQVLSRKLRLLGDHSITSTEVTKAPAKRDVHVDRMGGRFVQRKVRQDLSKTGWVEALLPSGRRGITRVARPGHLVAGQERFKAVKVRENSFRVFMRGACG